MSVCWCWLPWVHTRGAEGNWGPACRLCNESCVVPRLQALWREKEKELPLVVFSNLQSMGWGLVWGSNVPHNTSSQRLLVNRAV